MRSEVLQDLGREFRLYLLGLCVHQEGKDELERMRDQVLRCQIGLNKPNELSMLSRNVPVQRHHQHHDWLQQGLIVAVQLHQSLIEPHLEEARRDPIRNLADIGQGKQALMHERDRSLVKNADKLSQDGDFLGPLIEVADTRHIRKPFFPDVRIHRL